MLIMSPAFTLGAAIPVKHTCDAENLSPALQWSGAPTGTRTFALIVDDPDAPGGIWLHWTAWRLEGSELAEGARPPIEGTNSFKKVGYGGPCPPRGHGAHRYFFRLYALDTVVSLAPGATRAELEKAMKGHVLATAETMGKYWRDKE